MHTKHALFRPLLSAAGRVAKTGLGIGNKALRYAAKVPEGERMMATPWKGVQQATRLLVNPYLGRHGWIPKAGISTYVLGPPIWNGYQAGMQNTRTAGQVAELAGGVLGVPELSQAGPALQNAARSPYHMTRFLTGADDNVAPHVLPEARKFMTNELYHQVREFIRTFGHYDTKLKETAVRARGPLLPETFRTSMPWMAKAMPDDVTDSMLYAPVNYWRGLPEAERQRVSSNARQFYSRHISRFQPEIHFDR